MASTSPALAKSMARDSVSPVSRPDSALALPIGNSAGSVLARSTSCTAPLCQFTSRGDALAPQPHPGMGHAHLQHPRIADHDQMGDVGKVAVSQDPRRLLRPDSGAV